MVCEYTDIPSACHSQHNLSRLHRPLQLVEGHTQTKKDAVLGRTLTKSRDDASTRKNGAKQLHHLANYWWPGVATFNYVQNLSCA
jgi:hypothetical protein